MKEIIITKFGPPEVLQIRERPTPSPKKNEVLVRNHFAGINFSEIMARMRLYPGAPKQYPNLTLLNDAFVDSIRVSGYEKLTIYHNPNFTVLLKGNNRQKLVSTDKGIANYSMQLIDVETQTDERIELFMREK